MKYIKDINEMADSTQDLSFLLEGVMSDLHLLAKEVKTEEEFVKKFFKEHGDKVKKTPDSVEWVKSLYKDTIGESIDEAKRGTIHSAAKKASYPVTLVAIEKGKVVDQKLVGTPQIVPAAFNEMQKEYPNAKISVESKTGQIVFTESYDGNFSDFKYELEMAIDNLGISPKAIKAVKKKGKGYEVRMSSYMSDKNTWEKIGTDLGADLIDFKPGSINVGIYEAYIGPFVFNDKMSDEKLKDMYDAALDGYANYSKGFQHAKSKYKEAYQAIEKILKKRGVKVDESVNEGKKEDKMIKDAEAKVVKVVNDLKSNLEKFKAAKTPQEKEKYKKEAARLTKLRKEAQKEVDDVIANLHKDAKLEINEMKHIKVFKEFINEGGKANAMRYFKAKEKKKSQSDARKHNKKKEEESPEELELRAAAKMQKEEVTERYNWLITEGQFSWITQDTRQQIGNEPGNRIDVWMFDNEGNKWMEKRYDGYGEFGGMDYYDLVATMNGYDADRQKGIDLAFGKLKTKDKKRKTLFPALVTDPRYNWKQHDFTQEADSDPNQGWYTEEDDEYGW